LVFEGEALFPEEEGFRVEANMAMENGSRECDHECKSYVTKGIILTKCTFTECMGAPMQAFTIVMKHGQYI